MVGSDPKLASVEILFKVAQEMYYGEQFLSCDAIILSLLFRSHFRRL